VPLWATYYPIELLCNIEAALKPLTIGGEWRTRLLRSCMTSQQITKLLQDQEAVLRNRDTEIYHLTRGTFVYNSPTGTALIASKFKTLVHDV